MSKTGYHLSTASTRHWGLRALLACGLLLSSLGAQSFAASRERGYVALRQAVKDASADLHFLLVASHPDDRYLMPAAWLRFEMGFRVSTMLMTRGEGGQNSTGPETGDALAAIRTLETEAAAARLGFEVYYLGAPDRGYCRTVEEAIAEWGHQRTVEDMVRLLRILRPDVVLTTHHDNEGHGHDLALLELLPEAVELAGDPTFTLRELPAIRIERLFVGAAPEAMVPPGGMVVLDMDRVDEARGRTYRRLAYQTLVEEHRSQRPFQSMERLFHREIRLLPVPLRGEPGVSRLYEGLTTLFDLLPAPVGEIGDQERRALRTRSETTLKNQVGNPKQLIATALGLLADLEKFAAAPGSPLAARLAWRREALARIVIHASAFHCEVDVDEGAVAVPSEDLPVTLRLHNGTAVAVENIRFRGLGGAEIELAGEDEEPLTLAIRDSLILPAFYQVPAQWPGSDSPRSEVYRTDRFLAPVRMEVDCTIDGREFTIPLEIPVPVRPPIELASVPAKILLPAGNRSASLRIGVRRNSRMPIEGMLRIKGPPGHVIVGQPRQVKLSFETEPYLPPFTLTVPEERRAPVTVLRAQLGEETLRIPVHHVDVDIDPSLRVGLVRGQDDATDAVLRGLGVRLELLTDDDLIGGDLSTLDTIVVDIRAFRKQSRRGTFRRLLGFSRGAGKRLVVFYHKDAEFNPEQSGFVGYPHEPFRIGKGRVTQADAPVTILEPDHPLLNRPNQIRPKDWDGWAQERGLYFPEVFGEAYVPLLAMNDSGQPEERGSLLYAENGDGEYVYCALSLWRQLKKLHPGAVRLFANLISPTRRSG